MNREQLLLLGTLDLMEFPIGNRRMCPVCDGFNVSPAGATPQAHTPTCPVPRLLARIKALDASGKLWPTSSATARTRVPSQPVDRRSMLERERDATARTLKQAEGATQAQLITRGIKAAGGYPAPKGFKVIGYGYSVPKTTGSLVTMRKDYRIFANVSRIGAHHMTGRVYSRLIARGDTMDEALTRAIARVRKMRQAMRPKEWQPGPL